VRRDELTKFGLVAFTGHYRSFVFNRYCRNTQPTTQKLPRFSASKTSSGAVRGIKAIYKPEASLLLSESGMHHKKYIYGYREFYGLWGCRGIHAILKMGWNGGIWRIKTQAHADIG
jgi:hypothetical protein